MHLCSLRMDIFKDPGNFDFHPTKNMQTLHHTCRCVPYHIKGAL